MRLNQSEKFEIIQLVEKSDRDVYYTWKEVGVHKSIFYQCYHAYLTHGYDGLADKPCKHRQFWNQIPEPEKQQVVELALDHSDRSHREVACLYTYTFKRFVSESSVYQILKSKGMISTPAFMLMQSSIVFKDQTVIVTLAK